MDELSAAEALHLGALLRWARLDALAGPCTAYRGCGGWPVAGIVETWDLRQYGVCEAHLPAQAATGRCILTIEDVL